MIRRVPSDQIAVVWDFIKPSILNGFLLKDNEELATYMLKKFMSDDIHLWVIYDEDKLVGVFTTSFIKDPFGLLKLIILSLYGMGISTIVYGQFIDELKTYAKNMGCFSIVASSSSSRIIEMAKKFGARTNVVEITFDL